MNNPVAGFHLCADIWSCPACGSDLDDGPYNARCDRCGQDWSYARLLRDAEPPDYQHPED